LTKLSEPVAGSYLPPVRVEPFYIGIDATGLKMGIIINKLGGTSNHLTKAVRSSGIRLRILTQAAASKPPLQCKLGRFP
jgi:hypothetical protein